MSNVKKAVISQSIAKIKKQIEKIDGILDATPLQNIINMRQEAQSLLEQNKGIYPPTKEFLDKLNELSVKEKYEFEIAEKQKNTLSLIDKKVKLDRELRSLNSELFYLDKSNFK